MGRSIPEPKVIDVELADYLPPYAQLINHVAGLIKEDPPAAHKLAMFAEEAYPTDFVKASVTILRAQTYAVTEDWDNCIVYRCRARVLADVVRKTSCCPGFIAQMDNIEKGAKQLDELMPAEHKAEYTKLAELAAAAATKI